MQVKWSRLHLSDTLIKEEEYETVLPVGKGPIEPVNKMDLLQLRVPVMSILYAYEIAQEYKGYNLELEIELMIKGEKIYHKQLSSTKTRNYIYKTIQIDSCLCYQKLLTLILTLKLCESAQPQPNSLTLQSLLTQLSRRQFVLYNDKALITYKRDLIVKEPVNAVYRYHSVEGDQGYFWVKLSNLGQRVRVTAVGLMNWTVGELEVRGFEARSTMEAGGDGVELGKGEDMAVMLTINGNLRKIQIPYFLEFSHEICPGFKFKLIKYLYIE